MGDSVDIAIIGYACRLPGNVSTPEALWELCTRRRSGWSPMPKERFSFDAFYHPNPTKSGTFNPQGGYFLTDDLSQFDAGFFNITAAEATSMDPQQRLLLECTYEALENAGIPKEEIAGRKVGVFIGGNASDYDLRNSKDMETLPMHQITGCHMAMQSNRISYLFDLKGPSLTVDTACSSSLVALHHAVQSLTAGEASEAIVGGCRLNLIPDGFMSMSMSQLLNDTGKTFAFDERADSGFARGEGVGVVLLKRLDEAIRDNDPIRAVICGTGVNQDGRTQGITNPNGDAQRDLIRQVYADARLDVGLAAYAEMHGTGTKVGDPIEADAVHQALSAHRLPNDPLYIGSVKANVGHLENASGIISLIKASMMLEKGLMLPNTNFRKTNPNIPKDEWNLEVLTSTKPWPRGKKYVSVSNYGFGGTNAHAVLARAPTRDAQAVIAVRPGDAPDPVFQLFVISANDTKALQSRVKDIGTYIEVRPEVFEQFLPSNLAYTLGSKRSLLPYRLAISVSSLDELSNKLAQVSINTSKVLRPPLLGYVFTGQGAQWAGMGMDLFYQYPVFASAVMRADKYLHSIGAKFSLLGELEKTAKDSLINSPHISQPACTALQIGLVDLLKSWKISPDSVVGHSSGEIGAAYAAGVYDADAAMALAYYRGAMTSKLKDLCPKTRGGMITIGVSAEVAEQYLARVQNSYLTIACINSPSSVTISGDETAVVELKKLLDDDIVFNRLLKINVAYHSEHMAPLAKPYLASIAEYQPASRLTARFFSTVYGREVTDTSELGPQYWVKNLISTVMLPDAVSSMCSAGSKPDLLIEVGPHSALQGPVKEILRSIGTSGAKIGYTGSIIRHENGVQSVQAAAGVAYEYGAVIDTIAINFPSTNARYAAILKDLPRYPWQHNTSYWHHSRILEKHNQRPGKRNDILGALASFSNDLEPTWRNIIRLDDMPWLRHHRMQGVVVFPMAGYLCMAIEAAQQRAHERDQAFDSFELRDVHLDTALILDEGVDTEMMINVRPFNDASKSQSLTWDEFKICSWSHGRGWAENCRGLIRVQNSEKHRELTVVNHRLRLGSSIQKQFNEIRERCSQEVDVPSMYTFLATIGAGFGETFQGLRDCFLGPKCCRANISVQDTKRIMPEKFEPDLVIHPSLLDICFQVAWPILGAADGRLQSLYMPISVKSAKIRRDITGAPGDRLSLWCTGDPDYENPRPTVFEGCVTRESCPGEPLIKLDGFVVIPMQDIKASDSMSTKQTCYRLVSYPCDAEGSRSKYSSSDCSSPAGSTRVNGESHGTNKAVSLEHVSDSVVPNGEPNGELNGHTMDVEILIVQFGQCQTLARNLTENLFHSDVSRLSVHNLGEVDCFGKQVVLLETTKKSLRSISPEDFKELQNVLVSAKSVIWIYLQDRPEASMSVGLARSIRSENSLPIATLGIKQAELQADERNKSIMAVINMLWLVPDNAQSRDMEFIAKNGELLVQRIEEAGPLNKIVSIETGTAFFEKQPFKCAGRSLKLEIGNYGALDTIRWVDDNPETLGDDYIEIEVKATGVNFKDIVVCMGQVEQPYIGVECSGIVRLVGKNVTNIKVGQRVMALVGGAYSTYARCPATSAHILADGMTYEQAATIPSVFCTAYYALFDLGKLLEGEKILIHAAAGGVGQAAIMLAQMLGAEIFATVGSKEKKDFLMQRYSLPEERIFFSRNTSFAEDIRRTTKGIGVDVVLNSLSGDILRETWNCLAPFGRFIEIGKADINRNSRLDMSKFEYNCTFSSVDLTKVAGCKPRLMQRLLEDVCRLFDYKLLSPVAPIKVYSISETESAFRALQSGKAMGKLVVVASDDDKVLVCTDLRYNLRSDAL